MKPALRYSRAEADILKMNSYFPALGKICIWLSVVELVQ